jgi:DNA-binding phage protein
MKNKNETTTAKSNAQASAIKNDVVGKNEATKVVAETIVKPEREIIKTIRACRELVAAKLPATKIAKQLGLSNSYTNKLVALSRATEPTLSLIAAGKVSAWSTAKALKNDTGENVEKNIQQALQSADGSTDAAAKIAISKAVISQMPPVQPKAPKYGSEKMIAATLNDQRAKIIEMLKAGASVEDVENYNHAF